MSLTSVENTIVFREAHESDAAEMLAYLESITREWPNNLVLSSRDPLPTLEHEREYIRSLAAPNCLLVATEGAAIIGTLSLSRVDKDKIRHKATIGIAVRDGYRRRGIGERLMREAIERSRAAGIRRIDLSVFVRNHAAIELYRKLGFEIEGTLRRSILEDGELLDEYLMSLLL